MGSQEGRGASGHGREPGRPTQEGGENGLHDRFRYGEPLRHDPLRFQTRVEVLAAETRRVLRLRRIRGVKNPLAPVDPRYHRLLQLERLAVFS